MLRFVVVVSCRSLCLAGLGHSAVGLGCASPANQPALPCSLFDAPLLPFSLFGVWAFPLSPSDFSYLVNYLVTYLVSSPVSSFATLLVSYLVGSLLNYLVSSLVVSLGSSLASYLVSSLVNLLSLFQFSTSSIF